MLSGLRGFAQLIEPYRKAQVIRDHGPEVDGQGVHAERQGISVATVTGGEPATHTAASPAIVSVSPRGAGAGRQACAGCVLATGSNLRQPAR